MDYCHPCRRHLNGALACPGCGTPADSVRAYAAQHPVQIQTQAAAASGGADQSYGYGYAGAYGSAGTGGAYDGGQAAVPYQVPYQGGGAATGYGDGRAESSYGDGRESGGGTGRQRRQRRDGVRGGGRALGRPGGTSARAGTRWPGRRGGRGPRGPRREGPEDPDDPDHATMTGPTTTAPRAVPVAVTARPPHTGAADAGPCWSPPASCWRPAV